MHSVYSRKVQSFIRFAVSGLPDPFWQTGNCKCTKVGAQLLVLCSLSAENANFHFYRSAILLSLRPFQLFRLWSSGYRIIFMTISYSQIQFSKCTLKNAHTQKLICSRIRILSQRFNTNNFLRSFSKPKKKWKRWYYFSEPCTAHSLAPVIGRYIDANVFRYGPYKTYATACAFSHILAAKRGAETLPDLNGPGLFRYASKYFFGFRFYYGSAHISSRSKTIYPKLSV